jgi:hypothetical protein
VIRPRRAISAGLAAFALLATRPARGDEAEDLFQDGRRLMQDKRYEEACAKFKAAHDRDRTATGTLLNLALCHELVGKPATAWAELRQVEAESVGRREDRVAMAREHIAKLLPSLSYLTIAVPPASRVAGLVVTLDGRGIAEGAWDTEVPVDPGRHVVLAAAPHKLSATQDVDVGASADHRRVQVGRLEDSGEPAGEPSTDSASAARTRRTVGLALGGAGLVSVGVGVAFGLSSGSKYRTATRACPDDVCPTDDVRAQAVSDLSSAKTLANVSNVMVGAGALMVVGGVILVLSGRTPAPQAARAALRVVPAATPDGAALLVVGALR